jgi:hypothetical protein
MNLRIFAAALVATGSLGAGPASAQADVLVDASGQNTGTLDKGLKFGGPEPTGRRDKSCLVGKLCLGPTQTGIASNRSDGPNRYGLDVYTRNAARLSVTSAGLVGIGTKEPSRTVEVQHAGDVELGLKSSDPNGRLWTAQSSGDAVPGLSGTFQIIDRTAEKARLIIDAAGTVSVGVLRITGGSVVAEPFAMPDAIPLGSVVSIDPSSIGRLKLSDRAYDKGVAGIVSGANGVTPGLTLNQAGFGEGRYVALSGRVYVLADATRNPIRAGDLLTTSNLPGRAMKATDARRAQGAIIGKAMSPLQSGAGMVLVLVSLQ